jgi:hypothetical protein
LKVVVPRFVSCFLCKRRLLNLTRFAVSLVQQHRHGTRTTIITTTTSVIASMAGRSHDIWAVPALFYLTDEVDAEDLYTCESASSQELNQATPMTATTCNNSQMQTPPGPEPARCNINTAKSIGLIQFQGTPPSTNLMASAYQTPSPGTPMVLARGHDAPQPESRRTMTYKEDLDADDEAFIPSFAADAVNAAPLHVPTSCVTQQAQPQWTWPVREQQRDFSAVRPQRRVEHAQSPVTPSGRSNSQEIRSLRSWRRPSSPPTYATQTSTPPSLVSSSSSQPVIKALSPQAARVASQIQSHLQTAQQAGIGPSEVFVPMRIIQERNAGQTPYPNPTLDKAYFASAPIPADQNCALWITGIPPQATYSDFLSSVRGGKVYACLFNPPTGDFPTIAAKLVFFTRASAVEFLRRSESPEGIRVLGRRVKTFWNRIFYPAVNNPQQSRVVVISGPEELMSFEVFEGFFQARFLYDLDRCFEVPSGRVGVVSHVWRFASFRAQAESAKIAIEKELSPLFEVSYGLDPCDIPWY